MMKGRILAAESPLGHFAGLPWDFGHAVPNRRAMRLRREVVNGR